MTIFELMFGQNGPWQRIIVVRLHSTRLDCVGHGKRLRRSKEVRQIAELRRTTRKYDGLAVVEDPDHKLTLPQHKLELRFRGFPQFEDQIRGIRWPEVSREVHQSKQSGQRGIMPGEVQELDAWMMAWVNSRSCVDDMLSKYMQEWAGCQNACVLVEVAVQERIHAARESVNFGCGGLINTNLFVARQHVMVSTLATMYEIKELTWRGVLAHKGIQQCPIQQRFCLLGEILPFGMILQGLRVFP